MNKVRFSVIILNLVSVIGLTVFILFSYLQINNLKPPYGLNENYIKFSLEDNLYRPNDNNREKIIFKKIENLIHQQKITIINYNISKMGLGIYDSNNKYENLNMLKGKNILLKNESYFKNQNTIQSLSGINLKVIGYYDNKYPLYNSETEYIYNIFIDPTLGGEFYFITENKELISQIFNIFKEYDYKVNVYKTDYSFLHLLCYGLYSSSVLGMLFIYINLFIFYIYYCEKIKKTMKIHILYGAKYKDLVLVYLKNFTFNMLVGSIIGSILYCMLFKNSYLFNKNIVFASLLLNLAVNIILFIICLQLKKSKIYNNLAN